MLVARVGSDGVLSNGQFLKSFRDVFVHDTPKKRAFNLLDRGNKGYLVVEDFSPMMNTILEIYPGLDFLKATPEFQEKYAATVVQRIMFQLDWDDDGMISFRDFSHSKLFPAIFKLETEEEINSIRDFFIYEHFYVIYCKFYELDLDHDEYISKADFGKYNRHALSNNIVNRIWS